MTRARLGIALTIGMIGLAGCGGGDDAEGRTTAAAETSAAETSTADTSTPPPVDGDAVLIRTRVTDARAHTGEVLDGSVIGETAFCAGGTTSGSSRGPTITTTFTCPGGPLLLEYAPRQPSLVQSAAWEVVDATGDLEGLRGGGWMVAVFESDDPDAGTETFAGTVSSCRDRHRSRRGRGRTRPRPGTPGSGRAPSPRSARRRARRSTGSPAG